MCFSHKQRSGFLHTILFMEIIIIIAVALVVCKIACEVLVRLGYMSKEVTAYSNEDDLKIEHTKESKLARIHIVDSYTKGGEKYIVFKTDVSGWHQFTMSEQEYDKYIGLGNDAVDCTIWQLTADNVIYEEKYIQHKGIKRKDIENGIGKSDISDILWHHNCGENSCIVVDRAYGKRFQEGTYYIDVLCGVQKGTNYYSYIKNNLRVKRLSFLGKTDFSEDEIKEYKAALDKTGKKIVNICRGLTYGEKRRKKTKVVE